MSLEHDNSIGSVTNQVDMIGRPITIGDEIMCKYNSGSSANFGRAKIISQRKSGKKYTGNFDIIMHGSNVTTTKQTHRILVITDQIKANMRDYPEMFI